ncbi:MAG: hypothetical protein WCD38_12465 [Candidatus Tumulicola sp.]
MHRIQVQLTTEQERALKEIARLRGVSISALVREGVDRILEPERHRDDARVKRALGLIGLFNSKGPRDVSERHDEYVAEAIHERFARRSR